MLAPEDAVGILPTLVGIVTKRVAEKRGGALTTKRTTQAVDPFAVLTFPRRKVAFIGSVRTGDGSGANGFQIELPNRIPMFGEWSLKFAENQNNFDILVVSFGYADPLNVGNLDRRAKNEFSKSEVESCKELLISLVSNDAICDEIAPMAGLRNLFLGRLIFSDDWIKMNE